MKVLRIILKLREIFSKLGFLLLYLFITPYFLLIILGKKYMNNVNEISVVIFGLSFLPIFISFEISLVCIIIIISLPGIIIWPYFKFLRYLFLARIFSELFSV